MPTFNSALDDFRIYDCALDAGQVLADLDGEDPPDTDGDDDGVIDGDDECPDTAEDELVDELGCSLEDYLDEIDDSCPCETDADPDSVSDGFDPRTGQTYAECVTAAAWNLVDEGRITERELAEIQAEVERAVCEGWERGAILSPCKPSPWCCSPRTPAARASRTRSMSATPTSAVRPRCTTTSWRPPHRPGSRPRTSWT